MRKQDEDRQISYIALILIFAGISSANRIKRQATGDNDGTEAATMPSILPATTGDNDGTEAATMPSILPATTGDDDGTEAPTTPSILPATCGERSQTNARIKGGTAAGKGDWPWMVYVKEGPGDTATFCGGSLITEQHVVTAAHCVIYAPVEGYIFPRPPYWVSVRLGAYNLNEPDAIDIYVIDVRIHPSFNYSLVNDIAVLKLERPVSFTKTISPICLPYDSFVGEDLTNTSAIVVGFGQIIQNGSTSDILMQAEFMVQSEEICREVVGNEYFFNSFMCAGSFNASRGACEFDSGGPLMAIGANSRYYLIGIVSFKLKAFNCGEAPTVFTRVSLFLDWIRTKLY